VAFRGATVLPCILSGMQDPVVVPWDQGAVMRHPASSSLPLATSVRPIELRAVAYSGVPIPIYLSYTCSLVCLRSDPGLEPATAQASPSRTRLEL